MAKMRKKQLPCCKIFILIFAVAIKGVYSTGTKDDLISNCFIQTTDSEISSNVDQLIENGAKVVYFTFRFENVTSLPRDDKSNLYRPLSWVRASGRHGRNLLLLPQHYELFSLSFLNLATERVNVDVTQDPPGCLLDKNTTVISKVLREFLLQKFKFPSKNKTSGFERLDENENICSQQIIPRNGKAQFCYLCCHKTSQDDTLCQELTADKYFNVLFVCIIIVSVFAVMFSPLLIPAKFYKKVFETTSYEHRLKTSLNLSIKKISAKHKGTKYFPISSFEKMPEFKNSLQDLDIGVTYDVNLNTIDVVTQNDRLLPPNRVPVGLFETLYSAMIKCEIRKKASVQECCNSNVLGSCRQCNCVLPWYKLLRPMMHFILLLLVAAVWVIRIYFFYKYEASERLNKETIAKAKSLDLIYTGNLTWYLTPVHTAFIVCYCIFLLDLIVFGILNRKVQDALERVIRKCLRDMREMSRTRAIGWSVQILLYPFRHCGIFGILFAWLYYIPAIPIVIITLVVYCLPTINLFMRLLIYFVAYLIPYGRNCLTIRCCNGFCKLLNYIHSVFRMDILTKKESMERPVRISIKNRFVLLFVILLCLVSIMAFVLLATECIIFIVEVLMYTLIGMITNAAQTLKYISLIFLLFFYFRDSFSTVNTEYLSFNQFLHSYLVAKVRTEVEEISDLEESVQKNSAFQIVIDDIAGCEENCQSVSLLIKDGKLKWNIKRLILFLDKYDTSYITSKFFFDTCYLEVPGVPGPLLSSLLRAMGRFLIICVFLFFVVIVILAFGEEYGISATNQMFATLAGGFLPYILRFVLFKQPEPITVDPNNLSFKSQIKRKIEEYSQNWDISDIRISHISPRIQEIKNNKTDVDENGKSYNADIMLEEINLNMLDNAGEQVDILIYDKADV